MFKEVYRFPLLLLIHLKRDWKKIVFWVISLVLLTAGFVPAFDKLGAGQALIGEFEIMQNPAMIALVGPTPVQASEYTIGAMFTHEMLLFMAIIAMVISILHVVSHTRKDEANGLSELIRSTKVGRLANSFAIILETIFIQTLFVLINTFAMISFKVESIDLWGSFLLSLSIGVAGVFGALIALVMAQINETAAGANGMSLALIGLFYLGRALSDVSYHALTSYNPIAWTYLSYPFSNNDLIPILYLVLLSIILWFVASTLELKRDLGAGYLFAYEGRANAKKSLMSVIGIFWRLNKGSIITWFSTYIILGVTFGSIYGNMQTFLEGNDILKSFFLYSGSSLEASFTSVMVMFIMVTVAILPINIMNKLYLQEERMHLSQLYSTHKISRFKLFGTNLSLATLAILISILLSALSLGLTALTVMNSTTVMTLNDFMQASFNFMPAMFFFLALSCLFIAYLPKARNTVYVYLTYSFFMYYFKEILDLPKILEQTAIFNWISRVPVESFNMTVFYTTLCLSVVLIVLAYIGYLKRDTNEGL